MVLNIGSPDQTPRFAASGTGLHCLPISHKKDVRLTVSSLDLKLKKARKEYHHNWMIKDCDFVEPDLRPNCLKLQRQSLVK